MASILARTAGCAVRHALQRNSAVPGLAHSARAAAAAFQLSGQTRNRMKGLHPRMQPTFLILSDGSTMNIRSPLFASDDGVKMEDDAKNMPPWSPASDTMIDTSGQVAKFQARSEAIDAFIVPDNDFEEDEDDEW